MKIIVTCGPSYEPIDEVRRITNFSTGTLGTRLASALAEAGHEVICLKGVASTTSEKVSQAETVPFTTNADLLERLEELGQTRSVGAIFHAAALADFKVSWEGVGRRKISSREGPITLTLVPAEKVIGKLRGYFPEAKLIGWKYELDGGMEELLEKGERQMAENHTDYCILNGVAYGEGFGVQERGNALIHCVDPQTLCGWAKELVLGMGKEREIVRPLGD